MMVLHLNEAERAAYAREKQRQRSERYKENQAWKVQQREERYRQIELRISEVHEENERIKSAYQRLRDQYAELENSPAREKIVKVEVVKEVPTLFHVGNIDAVLKLCRESEPHWIQALWLELEPVIRQKCP